jgi:hypothetical protein
MKSFIVFPGGERFFHVFISVNWAENNYHLKLPVLRCSLAQFHIEHRRKNSNYSIIHENCHNGNFTISTAPSLSISGVANTLLNFI